MHDPVSLSTLYGFAIKEDQKQKIRELDFGSSSPQAQHNVMSMQLKAVDVSNVAVMIISSRTALLIETITKKTVVPAMANINITMIIDQNQLMKIPLKNQCRL